MSTNESIYEFISHNRQYHNHSLSPQHLPPPYHHHHYHHQNVVYQPHYNLNAASENHSRFQQQPSHHHQQSNGGNLRSPVYLPANKNRGPPPPSYRQQMSSPPIVPFHQQNSGNALIPAGAAVVPRRKSTDVSAANRLSFGGNMIRNHPPTPPTNRSPNENARFYAPCQRQSGAAIVQNNPSKYLVSPENRQSYHMNGATPNGQLSPPIQQQILHHMASNLYTPPSSNEFDKPAARTSSNSYVSTAHVHVEPDKRTPLRAVASSPKTSNGYVQRYVSPRSEGSGDSTGDRAPLPTSPPTSEVDISVTSADQSSRSPIKKPSTPVTKAKSRKNSSSKSDKVKYGELIPLGCAKPHAPRFVLQKRTAANGVKPSSARTVSTNNESAFSGGASKEYSVTYTLSKSSAVIVRYEADANRDMFQLGRADESQIDFRLDQLKAGDDNNQSTVSRYACRIVVDREPPFTARIFAAGFDAKRNIFLGEQAKKWNVDSKGRPKTSCDSLNAMMDGLTTNGVFVRLPFNVAAAKVKSTAESSPFLSSETQPCWMEVSVNGRLFPAGESRAAPDCDAAFADTDGGRDNVLHDGALIDLCGLTLLWRSADACRGFSKSVQKSFAKLTSRRIVCPVSLDTLQLVAPSLLSKSSAPPTPATPLTNPKDAFVYLACGHVQGKHPWGDDEASKDKKCPLCMLTGPFVQLKPGLESRFWLKPTTGPNSSSVKDACPDHCFKPCGHMINLESANFWARILVPHGATGFKRTCPFCSTPLQESEPFIKLIFQEQD